MTDKKISELTELTAAASNDVLPIVDVSASETKKITYANLTSGLGGLQVIGPYQVTHSDPICTLGVAFGPTLPAGTIVMDVNVVTTTPWVFTNTPQNPSLVVYFTNAAANNLAALTDSALGGTILSPFGELVIAGFTDSVIVNAPNFAALTADDQLNAFININGGGTATAGASDIYVLVQYP